MKKFPTNEYDEEIWMYISTAIFLSVLCLSFFVYSIWTTPAQITIDFNTNNYTYLALKEMNFSAAWKYSYLAEHENITINGKEEKQ